MANETDYIPLKQGGNGVTKNYHVDWKIFEAEDIIVQLENAETLEQVTLLLGQDYNVNFNNVGADVICVNAPAEGFDIIISRKTSEQQSSKYSTSTGFQGSEIEKSFDKVSTNIQDLDYTLQRAIKVPVGSEQLDLTLPAPVAGRTLKWNDEETGLINSDFDVDDAIELIQTAEENANESAISALTSAESALNSATSASASEANAEDSANRAEDYAQRLNNFSSNYTATIGTNWIGDTAPYTQTVEIEGILASDDPIMGLIMSDDYNVAIEEQAEYSKIYDGVAGADSITFYADDKTNKSLSIQLKVARTGGQNG